MPSCLACRPCAVLFSFLLPPSAPPPSPGSLSAPARHESCACSRLLREARARQSRIHVCYAHSQHIYAMRQNNVFFTILGSHQLMLPACSRCFTRAPVTCCWRAHHACTQCAHAKSCDNLTGLRAPGADSHLRAALSAGPAASGAVWNTTWSIVVAIRSATPAASQSMSGDRFGIPKPSPQGSSPGRRHVPRGALSLGSG
jgi:hypothetical protein